MSTELWFLYEWCLKGGQCEQLCAYLQYWRDEYLHGECEFPPLRLAYFQFNVDGISFDLDQLAFDPYTTTDTSGRKTWYTRTEPGPAKRHWNQAVTIRVSCEGSAPGDVLRLDMPAVPDFIISDIMVHLTGVRKDLEKKNIMEFQEASMYADVIHYL